MLDVGSHLGWYSIILANYYKDAQFYAFEPVTNTYTLLKKNISINKLTNIQAFNFGFSDKERLAKFYYSEIGSAVASERDIFNIQTLDTIECDLKKLDDFVTSEKIKKIDFIKCDVEGAEFLVIKGGENSIKEFLPILFLELVEDWCNKFGYTISDVLSFLSTLGYKMFEIKGEFLYPIHKIRPDKIDNFNYLFLNENKHKLFINKYMFQK
jgi:FkbM family methyltransferase